MTQDSYQDTQSVNSAKISDVFVDRPRPAWCDFLLHFCSFGLYTSFWMSARVSEIRRITKKPYTPWLWFFVPHGIPFQIFALPRLICDIDHLHEKADIPKWKNKWIFWLAGAFTTSAIYTYMSQADVYLWMFFPWLFLWSVTYTLLGQQVNKIKITHPSLSIFRPKLGLRLWEWLVFLFGFASTIFLLYLSLEQISARLGSIDLPDDYVFEDEELRYNLTLFGTGWRKVPLGTRSDDSADAEFVQFEYGPYFVVYSYSEDTDAKTVMENRYDGFSAELNAAVCRKRKVFTKNNYSLKTELICSGRELGENTIFTSSAVTSNGQTLELHGKMSGDLVRDKDKYAIFIKAAFSIEPSDE